MANRVSDTTDYSIRHAGFDFYAPNLNVLTMYPGMPENPVSRDYCVIKDEDLLRAQIHDMFNQPIQPLINVNCVKGVRLESFSDAQHNKKFYNTGSGRLNGYDYCNFTDLITDLMLINRQYVCLEVPNDIYAYHFVYRIRNNVNGVNKSTYEKLIDAMNKHYARNFITLTQTYYEYGCKHPSLHFIVSNAAYIISDKGNILFSKNINHKLQRIDTGFEYIVNGGNLEKHDELW